MAIADLIDELRERAEKEGGNSGGKKKHKPRTYDNLKTSLIAEIANNCTLSGHGKPSDIGYKVAKAETEDSQFAQALDTIVNKLLEVFPNE